MTRLRGNPWMVLITVSLGFFMTLLDTTIVNVAVPNMISHLRASLDGILWVLNGYTLAFAALLLIGGRLGDMYGRRRLLVGGLVLFVAASAACGLSQSPGELITARIFQGIGAAAMMPQTLALVTAVFPERRRGTAFGIWSSVAGLATVIAPTLGGVLVTYESWRWIFFVNVPIGAVSIALAVTMVPNVRPGGRRSLDPFSMLLSTAGLLAVVYALIEGQRYNWGHVWSLVSIPLILAFGLCCLALFVFVEHRRQQRGPLVPFALFRRDFSVMSFVTAAILFGSIGLLLPLMIYLQSVLGLSALATGLLLLPMTIVMLGLAPVAGHLSDKFGGKYILIAGLLVFAGGLVVIAFTAQADSSRWALLPGMLVAGVGTGMAFAPMNTLAMRGVKQELAGAASGVISTARQLGTVMGGAAVGALLQNRLVSALTGQAAQRAGSLPASIRGQFVNGFRQAASSGLQVGVGETGRPLPAGVHGALAAQVRRVTGEVFSHGFVTALRPSLLLPAGILVLGALTTLLIGRQATAAPTARADATGAVSEVDAKA